MASSPLTPEQIAELQAGAALMQQRVQTGINVPGGLMIGQPGQLSAVGSGLPGSLYDYAQTAPVLSLTGNKDYENLNFQALPGTEYRLTVGGQVVGSASTPEEVAALVERANAISESGGAKVDVRLQQAVQTADSQGVPSVQFADVYANRENNNGFLDVALPAALSVIGGGVLGPLIQGGQVAGTASALGTGLGAAAGSFGGSVLTGAPLDEALMKGAISGITAGGLQASGVFGGAPSGADGAASGKASAIAGTKLNAAGQIVDSVTGIPLSPAELIAAGASAPAAAAGSTVGSAAPGIVVSSTVPAAFAPVISSGLGGVAANAVSNLTGASEVLGNQPVTQEEWLQSTGQRLSDVSIAGIGGIAAGPISVPSEPVNVPGEMQTVTQTRPDDARLTPTLPTTSTTVPDRLVVDGSGDMVEVRNTSTQENPRGTLDAPITLPDGTLDFGSEVPLETATGSRPTAPPIPPVILNVPPVVIPQIPPPPTVTEPVQVSDGTLNVPPIPPVPIIPPPPTVTPPAGGGGLSIGDILNRLPLILSGIGGLIGGGGGDGGNGTGGIGGDNGFNQTVNWQPLNRQAITPTFDPFTYGQNEGEFRFFTDAQPQAGIGENAGILPPPRTPVTLKKGGPVSGGAGIGHYSAGPVRGKGSGQSDEVPALLSDGEYVFSAQDVSDLGDGSNDEGARRLDKMRQLIRKQAGRKNTKTIAKPQKSVSSLLRAAR